MLCIKMFAFKFVCARVRLGLCRICLRPNYLGFYVVFLHLLIFAVLLYILRSCTLFLILLRRSLATLHDPNSNEQ